MAASLPLACRAAELGRWFPLPGPERDTLLVLGSSAQPHHTSPEHPYRQLAALLREQIERGEIAAHLPSLTALTAQTGLATGTVRRAIDILAREHVVQTVPGRGTFVTRSAEKIASRSHVSTRPTPSLTGSAGK